MRVRRQMRGEARPGWRRRLLVSYLVVLALGSRSVPAEDLPIGSALAVRDPARWSASEPVRLAPVINRRKDPQPARLQTLAPVVKRATPVPFQDPVARRDASPESPTDEPAYGERTALLEAVTIDLREFDPTEGLETPVSSCPEETQLHVANPDILLVPAEEVPVSPLRTGRYTPDRSGRLVRMVPRTTPNLPAALSPRDDLTERPSGLSPAAVDANDWERDASDRAERALAPETRIPAILVTEQTFDQLQQLASPSDLRHTAPQPVPLESAPASPEELSLPSRAQEQFTQERFRPMHALGVNIAPQAGVMPPDRAAGWFAEAGQQIQATGYSRSYMETHFDWTAPAICHRPLFFEDTNLERHGYQVKHIQPFVSAAHFFSRLPAVPYLAMSQRYRQCNYTLGHYRPGSAAPYLCYYPRLSLAGASLEGAVIAGLILAIP